MTHPAQLISKLPQVGTTIFSVVSALANEKNAVNLGQGFPDFNCDPDLVNAVSEAMKSGFNQYPPMPGAAPLRQEIVKKIQAQCGHEYDVDAEVTVTPGATEAILTAVLACVRTGDEVIVLEPSYDSYVPAITLAGGTPVFVSMEFGAEGYFIPWDKVAKAVTSKTKMLIINNPHNPTGMILTKKDITALINIVQDTDILILSDEVYEHMVYDNQPHESMSAYEELAKRSFVTASFGKTFHVTGWKIGYVVAPAPLMKEFRKVHQYNVFSVNTPMQYGIAAFLKNPSHYRNLPQFYQRKRDLFIEGLKKTQLTLVPTHGTFFQCANYSAISNQSEGDFCQWLIEEHGVAAIPISAFYHEPQESHTIRFCFAKKDETLQLALEKLSSL